MSTKGSRAPPAGAVAKPYEPTPREGEALGAFRARLKERNPAPHSNRTVRSVPSISSREPSWPQVEALKRYRSRGEQTVRVEHVTVNKGGQAIVGNVTHGGEGLLAKNGGNLTKQEYSFQKAPRCSATSKRTRERCKAPAV